MLLNGKLYRTPSMSTHLYTLSWARNTTLLQKTNIVPGWNFQYSSLV